MNVQGIDFSALILRDALDLAILIEQEAEERYQELAQQMDAHRTPEAAKFFRFMAGNEARHGEQLSQRRSELFGTEPAVVTRAMLWDVEAPDYDKARAFMSAGVAMRVALQSEKKAHEFFVRALPQVHDAAVKTLFEELRDEEVEHQNLVSAELAKLPPDSALDPEDFVDEPTAQ